MELENVDISTELTRCINSIRSPTEGIEHEGEIYGVLGGQVHPEGVGSDEEQETGDADETMESYD
jgi:hypothetical protein